MRTPFGHEDPDDYEPPRKRRASGCWCSLDGYPGHCPGPQHCPYSGFHDKDEDEDESGNNDERS